VHDTILGAAGGDILVHDPANYGSLTITKPLAVLNDGVGTAGTSAPADGTAITINAGPNDAITLRGLTLDGLGSAAIGIAFNSGGRIEIQKSVIRNFTQIGIALLGSAYTYSISDTAVTDLPFNSSGGVIVIFGQGGASSPMQGILKNVDVSNVGLGISVEGYATIVNSNISNNAVGLQSLADLSIVNTTINQNHMAINNHGSLVLSRTTIQNNYDGIESLASVSTYGDNDINFNTTTPLGVTLTPVAKQ